MTEENHETEYWVLNATDSASDDGLYIFHPVNLDEDGNLQEIVVGIGLCAPWPKHGRVIAVIGKFNEMELARWNAGHPDIIRRIKTNYLD